MRAVGKVPLAESSVFSRLGLLILRGGGAGMFCISSAVCGRSLVYDLIESLPESAAVNMVGSLGGSLGWCRLGSGGNLSAQYSATSNKNSRPCVARSRVSVAAFVGKGAFRAGAVK